jgi:hypothetical protein
MNTEHGPRFRRLYAEWLVGALMIAGLVALVRAFF